MPYQLLSLARFYFIIFLGFCGSRALAQTAEIVEENFYGLPGENKLSQAILTKDKGYLIGSTWSGNSDAFKTGVFRGGNDFSVFKTNKKGKLLWAKSFGSQYKDDLVAICQTADGGYLLGGTNGWGNEQRRDSVQNFTDVTDTYKGRRDIWIVKIDSKGKKQWDKLFGGMYRDELGAIVPLKNGFLLAGSSESEISGNKSEKSRGGFDFWVLRIDLKGRIIWQRTLGGDGVDMAHTAIATPDGGFLVGGISNSKISGDKTQASHTIVKGDYNYYNLGSYENSPHAYNIGSDFWLVKLNAKGDKVWDRRYGGPADDKLKAILKLKDGNFLLGGTTRSGPGGDKLTGQRGGGSFVSSSDEDYWLVKINKEGLQLWEKTFGGSRGDDFQAVLETADGNLLIGGYSFSENSGDKTESHRGMTVWLLKTDLDGTKLWDKQFIGPPNTHTYKLDLMEPAKGKYVFIGFSEIRTKAQKPKNMTIFQSGANWNTINPNWVVEVKELDHPVISTGNVLPAICNDQPFEVPFTALGSFRTGNVFSAQLSDVKGEFNDQVTIGILETSGQGVHKIMATIPKGAAPGKEYRVRVVSSEPAIIGKENTETFGIGVHAIQVEISPWMSAKGGVSPYEYSLDGGAAVRTNLIELIKFSDPGRHEVTIRDFRNCTVSRTFWKGEGKSLDEIVRVIGVPNLMTWFELPTVDRNRMEHQGVFIEYEFEGTPGKVEVYHDGLQASTRDEKKAKGRLWFSYSYHDRNRDCIVVLQNMEPGTTCTFKVRLENQRDRDRDYEPDEDSEEEPEDEN